jgi:hypothetical protein
MGASTHQYAQLDAAVIALAELVSRRREHWDLERSPYVVELAAVLHLVQRAQCLPIHAELLGDLVDAILPKTSRPPPRGSGAWVPAAAFRPNGRERLVAYVLARGRGALCHI